MQVALFCTRATRSRVPLRSAHRFLSTTHAVPPHLSTSSLPWFVDPSDTVPKAPSSFTRNRNAADSHAPLAPLPVLLPEDSPIVQLHAALASSPFLEPGTLLVSEPIPTALGPALQRTEPKGRRKRGRTYSGEGIPESGSNVWDWVVIAQVCTQSSSRIQHRNIGSFCR